MAKTSEIVAILDHATQWSKPKPAAADRLARLQSEVKQYAGQPLPNVLIKILEWSNGAEGMLGGVYVRFWPAEDLVRRNQTYEVPRWLPGTLAFGTDAGEDAYLFDFRNPAASDDPPVLKVELSALFWDETAKLGDSLSEWLASLLKQDQE